MVINRTSMAGFVGRILKYNCVPAKTITITTACMEFKYTTDDKDDFDDDFKNLVDVAVNALFDSEYFSKAYKFISDDGYEFIVLLTYDKNVQIDTSK